MQCRVCLSGCLWRHSRQPEQMIKSKQQPTVYEMSHKIVSKAYCKMFLYHPSFVSFCPDYITFRHIWMTNKNSMLPFPESPSNDNVRSEQQHHNLSVCSNLCWRPWGHEPQSDTLMSPSLHIWVYLVCLAAFLATWSNSLPGGDQLTPLLHNKQQSAYSSLHRGDPLVLRGNSNTVMLGWGLFSIPTPTQHLSSQATWAKPHLQFVLLYLTSLHYISFPTR